MILGIDTSTTICSVALFDRSGMKALAEDHSPNSHSAVVTILIDQVLKEAGATMEDLEAIAFADGPGSYTGLRIGASAAKGICFIRDIPLIAIGHLRATAQEIRDAYEEADYFLAAIDARRTNVYALIMDNNGEEVMSAELLDVEKALPKRVKNLTGKFILAGNAGPKVIQHLEHEGVHKSEVVNSAANLRHESYELLDNQAFVRDMMFFEPFYMQSPRITQGKKLLL